MAIAIVIILLLTGCNSLYYPEPIDGMTLKIHVYQDADKLAAACGYDGDACAHRRGMTCDIHIPERAGYTWDHELTHCFGRQDAPVSLVWE